MPQRKSLLLPWKALPKRRGKDDPRLWLLGIARRKVADVLRRQTRRQETLAAEMPHEAGPAHRSAFQADLQRQEAVYEVRRLVDNLKPEQRDVLQLHYLEDLSIADISIVMHRSPKAVNSLLQRARAIPQSPWKPCRFTLTFYVAPKKRARWLDGDVAEAKWDSNHQQT